MDRWVVLYLAMMVLLVLVEGLAVGGVGTWLDNRASSTREEVEEDIAQYGPDAPGIRSELLPEDERQMVLAARRARLERWRKLHLMR
jgi:hypothetical protein